jgi:hypothetical protein
MNLLDDFNERVFSEATRAAYGAPAEDPLMRVAAYVYLRFSEGYVPAPHPHCSNGARRFSVYVPPRVLP